MSKHTSTHDAPIPDGPFPTFSSPVRAIAFDAISPRDRSLPATLCTISGTVAADAGHGMDTGSDGGPVPTGDSAVPSTASETGTPEPTVDSVLEPVANAVTVLEGYVQIRRGLLGSDQYSSHTRRDAAILASDHLHAAAYATLSASPVADRRSLELFRVAAEGSSTLATRFASWADGDQADHTDHAAHHGPTATLADIAAALGTTAVGATTETRTAMETYARSLSAALTAQASVSDDDPRETAVRVLSGHTDGSTAADDGARLTTVDRVDRHLERARDSLAILEDATSAETESESESESGPTSTVAHEVAGRSPLDRLELATRLPFRNDQ